MRIPVIITSVVAVVILLLIGSCSFTRVNSGHVGVRVNNIGSDAGVSPTALNVGWYFSPPGVTVYEYPVYTNNHTWNGAESFSFQDRNGLSISAAVSVAYRANPRLAPRLFQTYRVDMDGILEGALRNTIRNQLVTIASTMSVEEIYGSRKSELIDRALRGTNAYLSPRGLQVEQLYWAGNIILPRNIQRQINQRVANEQEALAAQASVATREAEARAAVARARGRAEALAIESAALTNNPEVLRLRAIERWNGHLPTYMASGNGDLPMIGPVR